jgi:hypothetical protein
MITLRFRVRREREIHRIKKESMSGFRRRDVPHLFFPINQICPEKKV